MSIEKVKASLQKAKNYQVLALGAASAALQSSISAALESFAADLDANALNATIAQSIKEAFEGTDLYAHQAEFDLTEMTTSLELEVCQLTTKVDELTQALAEAEASGKLTSEQNAIMTAEVDKHITSLQEKEAQLQSALTAADAATKACNSYKVQYEAIIAANAAADLKPYATAELQQPYAPPAGNDNDAEPDAAETDPHRKIEALYKKLTAKKQA